MVIADGISPIQIVLLVVATVPPVTPFSTIVKVVVSLHPDGVITTTETSLPSTNAFDAEVKLGTVDAAPWEEPLIKNSKVELATLDVALKVTESPVQIVSANALEVKEIVGGVA
jgi:hypothetical protein